MIQTLTNNKRIAITALALALLAVLCITTPALAQETDAACEGVRLVGGDCNAGNAGTSINNIISTIVDILSLLVGALSVIFIIVGGFRYVTSSGDSSKVNAARNTIIYAIVGLLVVLFARTIITFVIDQLEG